MYKYKVYACIFVLKYSKSSGKDKNYAKIKKIKKFSFKRLTKFEKSIII